MWNKFTDTTPKHGKTIEVILKDNTHHEVCTFFHAFEQLKPFLNRSSIEEYGVKYIENQLREKIQNGSIPKYFIDSWKGNESTKLNLDDLDKWRYLHKD